MFENLLEDHVETVDIDDMHSYTIANHIMSVYEIDENIRSAVVRQVVLMNRQSQCSKTLFVTGYADPLQKLRKMSIIDCTNTVIKLMNLVIGEKSSFCAEKVEVLLLNFYKRPE